jgi:tungstate transport system permease protein
MGLPPVVVGLVVYLLLSRAGPLGRARASVHADGDGHRPDDLGRRRSWRLWQQVIEDLWAEYREQLTSLGAKPGMHYGPCCGTVALAWLRPF